jgi:hypothetical protein
MSVTLYRLDSPRDPISIIVQAWMVLAEHQEYREVPSGYSWNAVGDLPVLQYKHHLVQKNNILHFLNVLLNFDEDLTESEKAVSLNLQQVCQDFLGPAVMFSLWGEEETSKDFWTPKSGFWEKLVTGPVQKVLFSLEKGRVLEALNKDFSIESASGALNKCKMAHLKLSHFLGEKNFFFSEAERPEHPRAADLVAYGYLKYQLITLKNHPQVTESLESHENLLKLILRVEDAILLKAKANRYDLSNYEFIKFPISSYSPQEFFSPVIYQSLDSLDNELSSLFHRCIWEQPPERVHSSTSSEAQILKTSSRSFYITSSFVALFLFFYLKT